ncbi:MAG: flagellar protein FlaG [Gammaproteobacteria bacterium]|nr:flagellar protein FlaG [Gammaproteobacteria bacterium]
MDIQDIKRLPAQFDTPQTRGQATNTASEVEHADALASTRQTETQAAAKSAQETPAQANVSPARQDDIAKAVEAIKSHTQNLDRELQFQIDSDTGRTVVTIKDAATQKVLRQIPSEEMLEIAKRLQSAQGVIFDTKA